MNLKQQQKLVQWTVETDVSRTGLAVKALYADKQKDLGSIPLRLSLSLQ